MERREKPEIVAPDGGNTTFFGVDILDPGDGSDTDTFPNFFGTSASAAHAAGVAALLWEANPSSNLASLYWTLESTALDMDSPEMSAFADGFDYGSGYGLIQADRAVAALQSIRNTYLPVALKQPACSEPRVSDGIPAWFNGQSRLLWHANNRFRAGLEGGESKIAPFSLGAQTGQDETLEVVVSHSSGVRRLGSP